MLVRYLGVMALLIPITGISTMIATIGMACSLHFTCGAHIPTLSYAATFKPTMHVFAVGMASTALFIFFSVSIFHWFIRLRISSLAHVPGNMKYHNLCALFFGATSAVALFTLAVNDMKNHHDVHVSSTCIFFVCAWITMVFVQLVRSRIMENEGHSIDVAGRPSSGRSRESVRQILQSSQLWARRRLVSTAHAVGMLFIGIGLTSSFLFGLLFLCVNGMWPNPLGFTALQEAFFEFLAIVCQLLFMGTLACELSLVARAVEKREYEMLEQVEWKHSA